jgi:hypothetical protein
VITERPIFITGLDRSGTSLLYALLSSHPNIAMYRRTNFWHYFYQRFGDLANEENFEACLDTLIHYDRLQTLNLNPNRIRSDFWKGETTYGSLLTLMLRPQAEKEDKSRWGDKSLRCEQYAGGIFKEFPEARIIQIIRDPRDRYASVLKRYKVNRGKAGANIGRWLYSALLGNRNVRRYPNRYRVIRYESLVTNPVSSLKEICHFLEEPYSEDMLSMQGAPTYLEQGGNSSFESFQPGVISTSPVKRYRDVLSVSDILFMQIIGRRWMSVFKYDTDPVNLRLGQWFQFIFIHFPLNFLRLISWVALRLYESTSRVQLPAYHLIPRESEKIEDESLSETG